MSNYVDISAPAMTGGIGGQDDFLSRLMAARQQRGPMVFNGPNLAPAPAQPAPGVPVVFNGPTMASPTVGGVSATSPVRDDVVRAMGGRDGQMPSVQQFLRTMPQSISQSFSAGSGQLGNPLDDWTARRSGHRGQGATEYTPASDGPVQVADHTQAGMNAYNHLLGQYTSGPESPTQAAARINQQLNDTVKTLHEYAGVNGQPGLAHQRVTNQNLQAQHETERSLMALQSQWLAQGIDQDTINERILQLRRNAAAGAGGVPAVAATNAPPAGNPGAPAPPVPGATAAPAQSPSATPSAPNRQAAILNNLYRDVARTYWTAPNGATPPVDPAHPAATPSFVATNQTRTNDALTAFMRSVGATSPEILRTPEGLNALREFVTHPTRFGQGNFDRWFTANPTGHLWTTEEQQDHAAQIERLRQARNAVAGPNDQIGYEGGGGPIGRFLRNAWFGD